MGMSMYVALLNKLNGPDSGIRLLLLVVIFVAYLFAGAQMFVMFNDDYDVREQKKLVAYAHKFAREHRCISTEDLSELVAMVSEAESSGIQMNVDWSKLTQNWDLGGETLFTTFTMVSWSNVTCYHIIFDS